MSARVGDVIETAEGLEALIRQYAEAGAPAVVQERGFRLWILTEDERGDHWAWSWREDDGPSEIEAEEGGTVVPVESLRLPLTALHVPGEIPQPVPVTPVPTAALDALRDAFTCKPGNDEDFVSDQAAIDFINAVDALNEGDH